MSSDPDRVITLAEVAKHKSEGDAWVVLNNFVYDVTKFAKFHPGGKAILLKHCGVDSTELFKQYHSDAVLPKYHKRFVIGRLAEADQPEQRPLYLSPNNFGDMIPYADPAWYQRFNSPYYNDSHRAFRAKVREWVTDVLLPSVPSWAQASEPCPKTLQSAGAAGFLTIMVGKPYPSEYSPVPLPEGCDYFHELILFDELARCGEAPLLAALTNGPAIALSPVLRFGTEEQKARVAPSVLAGKEFIALAISEPYAASDVSGVCTTAVKQGDKYIVNGNKKWITNGTYCKWFVTAVRTGGEGQKGLSFLLIDANAPGVTVRKMNIRNSSVSGTAYIDFDNVAVPVANLIGKENEGFKLIMHNFNHERWYLVVLALRSARVCIEQCVKYALRRETFGKPIHNHQTVRVKVAKMVRNVEALQHWLEAVTYQLNTLTHKEAMMALGDNICLLKVHTTKAFEEISREAVHIFGGNGLYMDGVGHLVENSGLAVKGYAIPGGAEDILEDFAARQIFKIAKSMAKM